MDKISHLAFDKFKNYCPRNTRNIRKKEKEIVARDFYFSLLFVLFVCFVGKIFVILPHLFNINSFAKPKSSYTADFARLSS